MAQDTTEQLFDQANQTVENTQNSNQVEFDGVIPTDAISNPVSTEIPEVSASPIEAEIEGLIGAEQARTEEIKAEAREREDRLAVFGETEGVAENFVTTFNEVVESQIDPSTRTKIEQLNKIMAVKKQRETALVAGDIEGTAGITKAVANRRENAELVRLQASIATDLAIKQNLEGRIEDAKETAKLAMDAETEAERRAFETEKMFLKNTYDTLSASEKTTTDLRLKKIEKREKELDKMSDIYANAVLNGADNQTLEDIKGARTVNDARKIAGTLAMSPQERLDLAIAGQQFDLNQIELDNLEATNPEEQAELEAVKELSSTDRTALQEANETVKEFDKLIETIKNTEDLQTLTSLTEEGRKFRRSAKNVADKMARERTGAVVSDDEIKIFKDILGISAFSQIASDDEEIVEQLEFLKGKHSDTVELIDPQGRVRSFLDRNAPESSEPTYDEQGNLVIEGAEESNAQFFSGN